MRVGIGETTFDNEVREGLSEELTLGLCEILTTTTTKRVIVKSQGKTDRENSKCQGPVAG